MPIIEDNETTEWDLAVENFQIDLSRIKKLAEAKEAKEKSLEETKKAEEAERAQKIALAREVRAEKQKKDDDDYAKRQATKEILKDVHPFGPSSKKKFFGKKPKRGEYSVKYCNEIKC